MILILYIFLSSLSLSTLSVSSGSVSSRGSLGSLASLGSTGSLASLSLTDIYVQGMGYPGYQVTNTSLQDLYRRVENLLQGHSSSISPSSSVSTSSQQGISTLTGSSHNPLPPPSSSSTSGAHSQSSLDNLGSNASSNTQLSKGTGSLENVVDISTALSNSPYLRRVASGELLGPLSSASPTTGTSPVPSPPVSPHGAVPPPSYQQHLRQRLMVEDPSSHGAITDNHHHQHHPHHHHIPWTRPPTQCLLTELLMAPTIVAWEDRILPIEGSSVTCHLIFLSQTTRTRY